MNSFMYPAIALMNRFSYNQKFAVISILWLLPIIALGWILYNQLEQQITESTKELQGSEVYFDLLEMEHGLQRQIDFETLSRQRQNAQFTDQLSLSSSNNQKALQSLEETHPELSDKTLKAVSTVMGGISNASQTLDISSQRNSFKQFEIDFVDAAQALAQDSYLALDGDKYILNRYQLVSSLNASLSPAFAKIRTYGIYSLYDGSLSYIASDELNRYYEVLLLTDKHLSELIETENNFTSAVKEDLTKLQTNLRNLINTIDTDIMNAIRLSLDWNLFSSEIDELYVNLGELNSIAETELQDVLKERLASQQQYLTLLFAIVIIVLSISAYLYTGFSISVKYAIETFSQAAQKVASGDLTVTMKKVTQDELGELTISFNDMTGQVKQLIIAARSMSEELSTDATTLNDLATTTRDTFRKQRAETDEISNAMSQMVNAVGEVASNTTQTSDAATQAEERAQKGRAIVEDTVQSIHRLANEIQLSVDHIHQVSEDSKEISNALVEIKAIAEQTNLLALNAAIEAARAGEQGRGFAVVADEVRTLSQRTQRSTEDIDRMVDKLHKGVALAVDSMNSSHKSTEQTVSHTTEVSGALQQIVDSVASIVSMSQQIAGAAEEQSLMTENIQRSATEISELGVQSEGNADDALTASDKLISSTRELESLINNFKT